MDLIPYSRQDISEDDISAVAEVLRSAFITQGPMVEAFEDSLRAYCNSTFAVALSSGTAALHCCAVALGIGAGDRVWVAPNSFVASANCARYVEATVEFVDIELATGNISIDALSAKLTAAERSGTLPRLLIVVHYSGRPVDMEAIALLARRYGFDVIEDAAHALGAQYADGSCVGTCQNSRATIVSFHPVKAITTGEGGAVLTQEPLLAERIRTLRTHGITRDPKNMLERNRPPYYYEQVELGFNYRLTDIQCALGLSQLKRADEFIEKRRALSVQYLARLAGLAADLPPPSDRSAWHLYPILVHSMHDRDKVFVKLRAAGVGVNVHYLPIHLQPYYRALGSKSGDCPDAEEFGRRVLTLPLFPGLSPDEQSYVVEKVQDALR